MYAPGFASTQWARVIEAVAASASPNAAAVGIAACWRWTATTRCVLVWAPKAVAPRYAATPTRQTTVATATAIFIVPGNATELRRDTVGAAMSGFPEAARQYVERNPESKRLHEARARVMPGGNTRSVLNLDPFPLTIVRADGARIWDADGHEYLDFLGEYTAGIYGHSHPVIHEAIRRALADWIVLGAPN